MILPAGAQFGWLYIYDLLTGVIGLSIAGEGKSVVQEPNFADSPDDGASAGAGAGAGAGAQSAPTSAAAAVTSGPPVVTCASAESDHPAENLLDGTTETYWESNGARRVELKSGTAGARLGMLEIYLKAFGHSYEARAVKIHKRTGGSGDWTLVKEMRLEIDGGWTELLSESEAGAADHFKIDITSCDGGADCRIAALRVGGSAGDGGEAGDGGDGAGGGQAEELIPPAESDEGAKIEWEDIKEEGTGASCQTLTRSPETSLTRRVATSQTLTPWCHLPTSGLETFWEFCKKHDAMKAIVKGPAGDGTEDPVELMQIKLGIGRSNEPVQAGPSGRGDTVKLTALPKLLWQILYLQGQGPQGTGLKYTKNGIMFKVMSIITHAFDQMFDHQDRIGESLEIDRRAREVADATRRKLAEAQAAEAEAERQLKRQLERQKEAAAGGEEREEGEEGEEEAEEAEEDDEVASAKSDELDDAGTFLGNWWGVGVRDAMGGLLLAARSDENISEEVLKAGIRAGQMLKLLPRFPYHLHQYACTHNGLLLTEDVDSRAFTAGLYAVCEWYAELPEENIDGKEPERLREELHDSAVFKYLISDERPLPQRENEEVVYLKPGHARLFNLCMPEITDFAQSRRELNNQPLRLASSTDDEEATARSLQLSEADVLAFADRPLMRMCSAPPAEVEGHDVSGLDLNRFVDCVNVDRLLDPACHTSPEVDLPFGEDVKCLVRDALEEEWASESRRSEDKEKTGELTDRLPFPKAYFRESATKPKIAQDMLARLRKDLSYSANDATSGYVASMRLLDGALIKQLAKQTENAVDARAIEQISATVSLPEKLKQLQALLELLDRQRERDADRVIDGSKRLVGLANSSSLTARDDTASGAARKVAAAECEANGGVGAVSESVRQPTGERELLIFQLKRFGGQRAFLHFEYITSAMISSKCAQDLQRLNPHLDHHVASHELPRACASILLHTIRLCQVNRAIVNAHSLAKDVTKLMHQQLLTQIAATSNLAPQRARAASGISVCDLVGAAVPTEEMLSWAMHSTGSPKEALCKVEKALADIKQQISSQNGPASAVALAFALCNYDTEKAAQLLRVPNWSQRAIELHERGCCVPNTDVLEAPPPARSVSGLGADLSLATHLMGSVSARSVRFTPIFYDGATSAKATEEGEDAYAYASVGRMGVRKMGAMLHAMNHTSLTLATELTARRHYQKRHIEEQVAALSPSDAGKKFHLGVVDANAQKMPALFVGDGETGRIVTWPGDVPEPSGGRFAEGGEIISVKANVGGKVEVRWAGYGVSATGGLSQTVDEFANPPRWQPIRWIYDPRFLVFEFLLGFMLRRRQYELVMEFGQRALEGQSSVNQMIMGQGKTTVIAPMLALILADGKRLISLVCPAPLLEMSRSVLRNCFSNVRTRARIELS